MQLMRILFSTALVFITVTQVLNGETHPMHIAIWSAAIYASTMFTLQEEIQKWGSQK